MHIAKPGIDMPLKVFSIFGVISGISLIFSLAYWALTANLGPVGYSSQFALLFFIMIGMAYGILVIFGALVVLSAPMNIEPRGGACLLRFRSVLFAIMGSFFLLSFFFLGPQ